MSKHGEQFKAVMAPAVGINQNDPINLISDQAWSDGNNVHFGPGYVEKVRGYVKFLNQATPRAPGTAYKLGEYVTPDEANTHIYKCAAAGTTGSAAPTWPTDAGETVTDGGVTWLEVGVNQLSGFPMAIDNYYKFNGDSYLLFITTTKIYNYNVTDNTAVDITGGTLSGVVDQPVFTENAQNYFVFTNGVDPVKYWTGTGNIADLPGLADCVPWNDGTPVTSVVAKCLLYFDQFLILGGTTENSVAYPQRLRWSAVGDITKWKNTNQATQDLQAGWADMTDGVDWIQALATIGNYIVAYKERSVQVVTYVGGDEIFDKWPAIEGTGLLAPKALMDLGDEHIFVGPDNIYSFDTREVKIAGDDIAKQFINNLDPARTSLTTCFYHEETPEGGFSFVSTSSPNDMPDKAIVYEPDIKAWSWRDLPMLCFGYYNLVDNPVWDTQEQQWGDSDFEWNASANLANAPINLCSDAQGYIYKFYGNSCDGEDLSCFIQTKLFDFGDPVLMKRLTRMQLMLSHEEPNYKLSVYVGVSNGMVDSPTDLTWYGPYYMGLDNPSPPWIDFDITARYAMFKFGTLHKDESWRLTGYIVYYQMRGPM
ncbi:MAG: hypothetical protein P4N41_13770 [Negativicutes bacterium]|nr:hypothetical protein [Negativicutes bacterium]MDR3590716.1 hypothetical protein [Negativicutes bacterium]